MAAFVAGGIWYLQLTQVIATASPVQNYLNALERGDASQALRLDHTSSNGSDPLLTDKAYRAAKGHISAYSIKSVTIKGDHAVVTAQLLQVGLYSTERFDLVKAGSVVPFVNTWQLEPVTLGHMKVTIDAPPGENLAINGQAIPGSGASSSLNLSAFPGEYMVTLANSNSWYSATTGTAWVNGLDSSKDQSAHVTANLTTAGMTVATAAVNTWLSACVASTDLQPTGCSFGVVDSDGSTNFSQQHWTLDTTPTFEIDSSWNSGWEVWTTEPGSASFVAVAHDPAGDEGIFASAAPIPVVIAGAITDISDQGATYVSDPFN